MKKEMAAIRVTTDSGMIHISQPDPIDEITPLIIIPPDQVDVIVKWLQEAKAEIEGNP